MADGHSEIGNDLGGSHLKRILENGKKIYLRFDEI